MSQAAEQVAKDIVAALESRIAGWMAERQSIEVERERRDRKEQRYRQLGELILEAQKEISAAAARLPDATASMKR